MTLWRLSHRADPKARVLADRHYNRQKIGSPQFVPPGRCLVLITQNEKAFWVTSWPFAQYVKHAWAGAWVCSAFRSEDAGVASELIQSAVAATIAHYGPAPPLGMITFVDRKKVRPTIVRGVNVWGWTYLKAGFEVAGETKGGLLALQMLPNRMPSPIAAQPFLEVEKCQTLNQSNSPMSKSGASMISRAAPTELTNLSVSLSEKTERRIASKILSGSSIASRRRASEDASCDGRVQSSLSDLFG